MVGGDDACDVRTVEVGVPPGAVGLGGDAVDTAGHGARLIHAAHEVGVGVIDTGVDDPDAHGGVRHRHGRGIRRAHGLRSPVGDRLLGAGLGSVLVAHRLRAAACGGGLRITALPLALRRVRLDPRVGGVGRVRLRRRGGLVGVGCRGGQVDALGIGDGGHAGRANGMDTHPSLGQRRGQVGGKRGRGALGEERADLRVGGERSPTEGGNERERTLNILGVGGASEIDGVVHDAVGGAGG